MSHNHRARRVHRRNAGRDQTAGGPSARRPASCAPDPSRERRRRSAARMHSVTWALSARFERVRYVNRAVAANQLPVRAHRAGASRALVTAPDFVWRPPAGVKHTRLGVAVRRYHLYGALALFVAARANAQDRSAITSDVEAVYGQSEVLYRYLHQHPELSGKEAQTAIQNAGELLQRALDVTTV